ncbi:MAG: HEAT repeat domain-containing protein [Aulosira sp. ZfuVER01]|nr:HEAT repeat domain-containing protein [Aulosira sp. ZfuVER01]MDZ7999098.1 HEAT repeat domain-containing protein [Aulosira sp. DedVER01a]MDZ8051178.1 HEAT repeat domain-containing protein [Aulosira sp. ZfuCHP01]
MTTDHTLDIAIQLASPDEEIRLRAAQTLATAEVNDAEQMLVSALGDASWQVRRAVVNSLIQRQGTSTGTLLLRSLRQHHHNPSILNGVLQVLNHYHIDTVPALIECLKDADVDLRIYAAQALGGQHDNRAILALICALEDSNINVRYHAIDALGHLQADEAVAAMLKIAKSGDCFLAFAALDTLKRIGDRTKIPLLEDEIFHTSAANTLS